jgi:antitoxin PrlF
MIATLTSKGQITLPKAVRNNMDLKSGDRLDFVVTDDGLLEAVPLKQPVTRLKGILRRKGRPVSIEAMNRAVAEGASGRERH